MVGISGDVLWLGLIFGHGQRQEAVSVQGTENTQCDQDTRVGRRVKTNGHSKVQVNAEITYRVTVEGSAAPAEIPEEF